MEEIKTIDSLPEVPATVFDMVKEAAPDPLPTPIDQPETPVPVPEPNSSENNFKALRQLREKAEKERDEAIRRAQELEQRYSSQAHTPELSTPQDTSDFNIGNDELAEGKHLKAVVNEVKKLQNQLKQYQTQSSSSLVEQRLKLEYPDIDKVVSKENVEILSIQYPALAATITESSDLYNKAVSAYTLIKKLGIQPEDNYETDRVRAQLNANKPRPLTSVNPQQGDSPLSHANAFANGLTPELKSQLLKEMMEARK